MLAMMLASEPMMPTPMIITKVAAAPDGWSKAVTITHRGDGHDCPPQGVAARRDVGIRRPALRIEHDDAGTADDQQGEHGRDNPRVLGAITQDITQHLLLVLTAQAARDTAEPAQPHQTEEPDRFSTADRGQGAEQIEPATLLEEVGPLGARAAE
jgi:hypothetical protein